MIITTSTPAGIGGGFELVAVYRCGQPKLTSFHQLATQCDRTRQWNGSYPRAAFMVIPLREGTGYIFTSLFCGSSVPIMASLDYDVATGRTVIRRVIDRGRYIILADLHGHDVFVIVADGYGQPCRIGGGGSSKWITIVIVSTKPDKLTFAAILLMVIRPFLRPAYCSSWIMAVTW